MGAAILETLEIVFFIVTSYGLAFIAILDCAHDDPPRR